MVLYVRLFVKIQGDKMAVRPKPYKLVCPKCGFTKIVTPKSDASTMIEDLSSCPKCEVRMEIKYSESKSSTNTYSSII